MMVPVKLDLAALRRAPGDAPAVLRALVPTPRRVARGEADVDSLLGRIIGHPLPERLAALRELVRVHASAVLGLGPAEPIDADRAFSDLGFDSLTAVELRNRLSAATGMQLTSTLVFDHPTMTELAAYLHDALLGTEGGQKEAILPAAAAATSQ